MKLLEHYEIFISNPELSDAEIDFFVDELFKACHANKGWSYSIIKPQLISIFAIVGNRKHFNSLLNRLKRDHDCKIFYEDYVYADKKILIDTYTSDLRDYELDIYRDALIDAMTADSYITLHKGDIYIIGDLNDCQRFTKLLYEMEDRGCVVEDLPSEVIEIT